MNKLTLMTTALLVGAMPIGSAFADTPSDPLDYTVELKGALLPVQLEELDYPYNAIRKGASGTCDLTVTATPSGDIGDMQVTTCSHRYFEMAAERLIRDQSFTGESTDQATTYPMTINWSVDPKKD